MNDTWALEVMGELSHCDKIHPKSNVFTPAVKNLATADCKHDSTEDCALFLQNRGLVKLFSLKVAVFQNMNSMFVLAATTM